ncbi:hypothetical protein [Candidatus Tisiphia endosymbiont of Hybos culiciformis]|uniref:hypothetical protein n=1 Tax=Candidatus Tisiphia endosymbiont of Hybos culiciformis TaxID=3139331 RepID=UPI003CCB166B
MIRNRLPQPLRGLAMTEAVLPNGHCEEVIRPTKQSKKTYITRLLCRLMPSRNEFVVAITT